MKTLFLDMNIKGLKGIEPNDRPSKIFVNWVEQTMVLFERQRHEGKGSSPEQLRTIFNINKKLEKALEENEEADRVELEDDQFDYIKRCLRETRTDAQFAMIVVYALECLERSVDFNSSEVKLKEVPNG